MATIAATRRSSRIARQKRVRKKIRGTDAKPRLCVFRSLHYTYAQLISDESGTVIASASTREVAVDGVSPKSVEAAKAVGAAIAEKAKEANVVKAVFDRNGYVFHGRVTAVATGARDAGLEF